jgi:hypothetical protein
MTADVSASPKIFYGSVLVNGVRITDREVSLSNASNMILLHGAACSSKIDCCMYI